MATQSTHRWHSRAVGKGSLPIYSLCSQGCLLEIPDRQLGSLVALERICCDSSHQIFSPSLLIISPGKLRVKKLGWVSTSGEDCVRVHACVYYAHLGIQAW